MSRGGDPPDGKDGAWEADLIRVLSLLREAGGDMESLLTQVRYRTPGGPLVTSAAPRVLLPRSDQIRRMCDQIAGATSDGAKTAAVFEGLAQEEAEAREAFLRQIHERLVFIGGSKPPETWSILGWLKDGRLVALDRDTGQIILCAGIPGRGKSILATGFGESCLGVVPGLTSPIPRRTAVCFFHIEEQDRLPQQLAGLRPNKDERDLSVLAQRLGLGPAAIDRLNLVMPEHLIKFYLEALRPYLELGLRLIPLRVRLPELGLPGMEAALGAESEARYVHRILEDVQDETRPLNMPAWHGLIDLATDLPINLRQAAHRRLRVLDQIASPPGGPSLWDWFEPGVMTVVFLGGPHMPARDVLPQVVALMNAMMRPSPRHGTFQRVFFADEVNRFDNDQAAWRHFTRVARLVRHLGCTLCLLGQDLLSVPDELMGLSTLCAVFRLRNPRIFEHIRDRIGGFGCWTFQHVHDMAVAEALVSVSESLDPSWQAWAQMMYVRPLRCEHGGYTRAEI